METILQDILQETLIGNGDSDKHLMTLFSLIISTNSRNIIELGVRTGKTTLPLLLGSHYTNGKVTSVDINDTNFECPEILKDRWTLKNKILWHF